MSADSKINILVVDDDDAKRYLVARILRGAGFSVEETRTGQQALHLATSGHQLIVLDIGLPDINGFEVCRRLKQNLATSMIPVLQVSATFVEPADRVLGLESGADAYLTDAASAPELVATVRALLRTREAEETARRLARQWQGTFDAIGDGILLVDAQGLIARCNQAMSQIVGLSSDCMLGQPLDVVLPAEMVDLVRPWLNGKGTLHPREFALRGSWYRLSAGHIDSGSGMVCTLADVTERRRAEDSLRLLVNVGSSLGGLVDYDTALQIITRVAVPNFADWCVLDLIDEKGEVRLGAAAHADPALEPLVRRLHELSPPRSMLEGAAGMELISTHGQIVDCSARPGELSSCAGSDQEEILRRLHPVSCIAMPVVMRGRILGVLRFFTSRNVPYTEADLLLAKEITRRAATAMENSQLYRALKEGDRKKDEFLAMLAHELRNPLAPIRSAADLLQLDAANPETVELARVSIDQQLQHITRLVDDLLDVARIMQGKITLHLDPVEIASIIQRGVEISKSLIEGQRHELSIVLPGRPVWVDGDIIRLSQSVANLINNAAKYTEPGGQIRVVVETEEDRVAIHVRDNGIGISGEMLPHVFDLFAQADPSIERSQGGLGIGLTLVRSLVEMHGGSVLAYSAGFGCGSDFTIYLPTRSASTSLPSPSVDIARNIPRRVLVVDDNKGAAQLLARLIAKLGDHTVEMRYDGLAALECAETFRPEMILLDIGLPMMSGYDVAHQLRQRPESKDTLLVALTGYGQAKDRKQSEEVGFDEHLIKPASLDMLRKLLSHPKLRG